MAACNPATPANHPTAHASPEPITPAAEERANIAVVRPFAEV
jgi:hypothetical protein